MQRPENVSRTVVSDDHNAIATRRDEGVIHGRHCVFMPVRCSNYKGYKWHLFKPLSNVSNHFDELYQKFSALHHLFAIEPDVEVASDAIDMRLGNPVCAGVLGVGMAKSDVDPRDFFVL